MNWASKNILGYFSPAIYTDLKPGIKPVPLEACWQIVKSVNGVYDGDQNTSVARVGVEYSQMKNGLSFRTGIVICNMSPNVTKGFVSLHIDSKYRPFANIQYNIPRFV